MIDFHDPEYAPLVDSIAYQQFCLQIGGAHFNEQDVVTVGQAQADWLHRHEISTLNPLETLALNTLVNHRMHVLLHELYQHAYDVVNASREPTDEDVADFISGIEHLLETKGEEDE